MNSADQVLGEFLAAVMQRMKALGLNQTTLAKRLNVARPYVTKMLAGDVNISFGAAYRLARAVEMDFCHTLRRTRHKLASAFSSSTSNSHSNSPSNSLLQTPNFKLQTLSPPPILALA